MIEKWQYYAPDKGLRKASKIGCKELADLALAISKGAYDLIQALYWASRSGHRELVDLYISKGADDWNRALAGASRSGHCELVDLALAISKGADDWNWALKGASYGGHRELEEFFRNKIENG